MNAKELEKKVKNKEKAEEKAEEKTEDKAEETAGTQDKAEAVKEDPKEAEASEETVKKEEAVKEKKEKKDKKDEEIAALNDRILRQMAEFDNYRKRTEKEKSAMFDLGAKNIVEKILPVIDNFERGFDMLSEEEKAQPFAAGMEKVYKQMMNGLSEAGLKEIEALNCEFNPDLHNAVMHVEDENVGENTIVEVFQKGYYYKDTIVRHSMVKVAN